MDAEMPEVSELLQCLEIVTINADSDKLWGTEARKLFTVKECYKTFMKQLQQSTNTQGPGIPRDMIWDSQIPPRINFLVGGRQSSHTDKDQTVEDIPTPEQFPHQNNICNRAEEDITHLLLT